MKHIRLSIERFWLEAGNFELWCELLSRIPAQTKSKTMKEIAALYLNKDIVEKDKKLDHSKELFGLLGYELFHRSEQFEIKGVNFLKRIDGYFQFTEDAEEIVNAYLKNDSWEVLLAKQLLRFSPRTRVIIHLLLNGGSFVTNNASLKNYGRWQLEFNDVFYNPFASNQKINNMNYLLQEYKEEALGNEWKVILKEYRIDLEEDWSFIGAGGKEPAKTNLTAFMRAPMQLFDYLDWLIETSDGKVILNQEKMKYDIGELDALFNITTRESVDELHSFKEIVDLLSDDRGFFPVEPAIKQFLEKHYLSWGKGLSRFVDFYITNGMKKGLFTIGAHESGQPRHGRGYLGKREYQLIKLDIHR